MHNHKRMTELSLFHSCIISRKDLLETIIIRLIYFFIVVGVHPHIILLQTKSGRDSLIITGWVHTSQKALKRPDSSTQISNRRVANFFLLQMMRIFYYSSIIIMNIYLLRWEWNKVFLPLPSSFHVYWGYKRHPVRQVCIKWLFLTKDHQEEYVAHHQHHGAFYRNSYKMMCINVTFREDFKRSKHEKEEWEDDAEKCLLN